MSLYSTIHLNSQVTPEKPAVLAEERVFVYIPKATYNSYGIAKFLPTQFIIVNGEVQINPHFTFNPRILISPDEPTSDSVQIWYKIIESTE